MQKATTIMSSSEEVLKRVARRCSNETCQPQERHRHVQLISGRAKAAQVYPREFGVQVCEGIAAQKKLEQLGLQARPVMSFEEMSQHARAVMAIKTDECPSAALHEADGHGYVATDDITGQELSPALMVQARRDEIRYFL